MLQHQRASQPEHDSKRHRDAEREQENSRSMEEGKDVDLLSVELRKRPEETTSQPPYR